MADQAVAPVRAGERLKSLDVLRGFALLGILAPNVVSFGWPGMAMVDHHVLGDTRANYLGHAITSTVFLGKFMFLFAMLFGAGVIVYAHKYDRADEPTKLSTGGWLWHRRCLVLLFFGLIHAYLFWYGDILTWYAVAGMTIVWWIRRVRTSILLPLAIGLYLLGTTLLAGFSAMGLWAVQEGHISQDELLGGGTEREIIAYTGTWLDALRIRFTSTIFMHLLLLPFFVPAIVGLMSLGMVLMRNGVLAGQKSVRFYLTTGVVGVVLGGAITLGVFALTGGGHDWRANFMWQPLAQPVGIPLALGYAMLIITVSKTPMLNFISTPLAAVGRMALTNYFLHTLLCTTFFYGYGLGYFASVEYPQLWLVIGAVWTVNVAFSLFWLRFFRFGPFEWLWRCMTYGKLLPILHTPSTAVQSAG
ncbi:MAG: DUF418 domain-containing protein [Phycisphaerales bacterium]|nr:DUF418 domain-containing protein [Phycisphaerales bacterium]